MLWTRNAHAEQPVWSSILRMGAQADGLATETSIRDGDRDGAVVREPVLSSDIVEVLSNAHLVIVAVPSAAMRPTARLLAPLMRPGTPVVSATKGLEPGTGLRVSQVWIDEIGDSSAPGAPFVALSGPNLASEIAQGLPAAAVVAGNDGEIVRVVRDTLATPRFRVYSSDDIIGVEMGGSLKNVLAIAAGISDGLGYGDNARAALLTRGLAEIARLGVAAGAQERTFFGLSGLGDVMATCTSPLSRNYHVGWQIGQGQSVEAALAAVAGVAEGVSTVGAALDLAERLGLVGAQDLPIATQVEAVLNQGKTPRDAVDTLLTRAMRDE